MAEEKIDLTGISLNSSSRGIVMRHSRTASAADTIVHGISPEKLDSPYQLLECYKYSGFQASALGHASEILDAMLSWRLSQEELTIEETRELAEIPKLLEADPKSLKGVDFTWAAPLVRNVTRATIFLSFTSNLISSGLRECLVYLARERLVDVIATSAGGVEEDFIKCFGEFINGDFHKRRGQELRQDGWNRIGNIYVPNENYIKFEEWIIPIFDEMLHEQQTQSMKWTPSKMIKRLGEKIEDHTSLYYWCAKHDIPVFCPSITDGSIGDCLYFYNLHRDVKLVIDIVEDIISVNERARTAKKSGMLILGGGMPKHHICNANLMRNGADWAIYINTAQEYDGSDSGATPDEAISWGKISLNAQSVKVVCDATIALPILISTIGRKHAEERSAHKTEFITTRLY